ncbi:MAG: hypothetical protein GC191_11345 [Azospirillum sp.]|nr:hypothetical protein [Azospirillum sp.]
MTDTAIASTGRRPPQPARPAGVFSAAARLFGVLLGAATLAACAFGGGESRVFVAAAGGLGANATVAVLPLENLTSHQNAGLIAADLISTELYRQGRLAQMEPTKARNLLAGAKIDVERLSETSYAAEAARKLGVDAVMVGSVSEFGYQHGLREEPAVGVTARLVRARDGAVVWAASDSQVGASPFTRQSVNAVAQQVVGRMVESLAKAVQ